MGVRTLLTINITTFHLQLYCWYVQQTTALGEWKMLSSYMCMILYKRRHNNKKISNQMYLWLCHVCMVHVALCRRGIKPVLKMYMYRVHSGFWSAYLQWWLMIKLLWITKDHVSTCMCAHSGFQTGGGKGGISPQVTCSPPSPPPRGMRLLLYVTVYIICKYHQTKNHSIKGTCTCVLTKGLASFVQRSRHFFHCTTCWITTIFGFVYTLMFDKSVDDKSPSLAI